MTRMRCACGSEHFYIESRGIGMYAVCISDGQVYDFDDILTGAGPSDWIPEGAT
jgi:hypothetical protein